MTSLLFPNESSPERTTFHADALRVVRKAVNMVSPDRTQATVGESFSSCSTDSDDSRSSVESDDSTQASHSVFQFPQQLADKADWLMQCRHPSEWLATETPASPKTVRVKAPIQKTSSGLSTYDEFPAHCEYCDAPTLEECICQDRILTASTSRPNSYFSRQRPPFWPKQSQWKDPVKDLDDCTLTTAGSTQMASLDARTTSEDSSSKEYDEFTTRLFGTGVMSWSADSEDWHGKR